MHVVRDRWWYPSSGALLLDYVFLAKDLIYLFISVFVNASLQKTELREDPVQK